MRNFEFDKLCDLLWGNYSIAKFENNNEKKNMQSVDGAKNFVKFTDGKITVTLPNFFNSIYIMPDIINVKRYNDKNNRNKSVIVYFSDGTFEKAILNKEDNYNFETGISICITKKLLSDLSKGNGSSIYNKIIRRGLKVYAKNEEEKENAIKEKQRIKNKKEQVTKKRAEKQRERLIDIQKEAYLRAMKEINLHKKENNDSKC